MLGKVLRCVENIAVVLACATLFLMMVLVTADAFGRYLFRAPLEIQFELTQNYLMVISVTLALSWGYREGGRIFVSFFVEYLPVRVKALVQVINLALAAIVLLAITWISAEDVFTTFRNHDITLGVIDWPVGYARMWVPIGTGILSLRVLFDALGYASQALGARPRPPSAEATPSGR